MKRIKLKLAVLHNIGGGGRSIRIQADPDCCVYTNRDMAV